MNSMIKSKSWQIMVHFARGLDRIKKHPQINHVEETENVKWCVLKSLSIQRKDEDMYFIEQSKTDVTCH